MLDPLLLRVRKKTIVPTKYQTNNLYRIDWKHAIKLDYSDTKKLFNSIGGGPIKTDAQFAYLLYKCCGKGTYSVLAWKKGREGFYSFIKLELESHGFRRLKKEKNFNQKLHEESKREIKKFESMLNEETNQTKKEDIKQNIEDLKEDLDLDKEIMQEEEKNIKRGPSPYLKQSQPVYSFHSYEDFNNIEEDNLNKEDSMIW